MLITERNQPYRRPHGCKVELVTIRIMALILPSARVRMVPSCTLPVFASLRISNLTPKSFGLMNETREFYQFNEDNDNNGYYCNASWGFLTTNISELAGFHSQ